MNEAVKTPQILLVESDDPGASSLAKRLAKNGSEQQLDTETVSEKTFLELLPSLQADDRQPDVICVSVDAKGLSALVRSTQSAGLDSYLFFVTQGAESAASLQRRLHLLPLSEMQWSVLDVADESLEERVASAIEQVQNQRRHNARIGRANRAITDRAANTTPQIKSRSDYYLGRFLEYAQDAIVAVDQDEVVLFWSAGAETLFGTSPNVVVGSKIQELPIWSPQLGECIKQGTSKTGPTAVNAEHRLFGRPVNIETLCSPVRDERGNYMGMSLISRDVSERQQAFKAERERHVRNRVAAEKERQKLRKLFEQAPGFIAITTGAEHVFTIANKAYLQVIGHRSIIGKPAREALPEMRGQEFLNLLDHVYESQKAFVGRAMPLKVAADGGPETRFVDFVFQPILEEDGSVSGIFCQGADVTQHKRTQEELDEHLHNLEHLVESRTQELKESQEALFASRKLEAIGKLTGGVAHDFNNVLQIVAGNLELMELQSGGSYEPRKFTGYLSAALDAVTRGKNLSSQLLAFARRQPLEPVPTHLGKLLRNMDHLLRRALGETIEVETVVAGGLWNTNVDPNQLENVILNLALNAKDAMPGGGKLTLEVGNAVLDDHYVALQPDIPPGQYVLIAISDTGSGMSQEVIDHAFEPFFTTKGEGEGTGLGLSMAYGFTKQSGGHIRIYSELGSGTTFRIYLPRTFESEVEAPRRGGVALKGGTETVLVVEDDVAVRSAAVRMLEELGYSVLQASDGQGAITVLQSGVNIDLLFSDVVMPGPVRSTEVAKRAKELLPDIEVLFTSGYTQNAIVHGGRLDPGVELISKPYRREELARKVRQLLDRKPGADTTEDDQAVKDSLHILLVEDEPDSRSATQELLTALGHKATAVSNAEDALAEVVDQFDMLITDVSLPGMSGLELIERARQINPRLRVIVASGYSEHSVNGAVQLIKPFDLRALEEAVQRAKGPMV